MGVEYQIDMSLFESINEDGHTDVASSKRKVMIMVEDSHKYTIEQIKWNEQRRFITELVDR